MLAKEARKEHRKPLKHTIMYCTIHALNGMQGLAEDDIRIQRNTSLRARDIIQKAPKKMDRPLETQSFA
jgi:hypothetical protein